MWQMAVFVKMGRSTDTVCYREDQNHTPTRMSGNVLKVTQGDPHCVEVIVDNEEVSSVVVLVACYTAHMRQGRTKPKRLAPTYIVGLVDGEGCFSVRLNSSQRRRAKVDMGFSVKIRAVDRIVLFRLLEYFKCGGVYIQNDHRPNHALCYRYEVNGKVNLKNVIIPFFNRYPFLTVTKQRDFKLFSQILDLVVEKQHLTDQGLKKIERLKRQMHLGSPDAGNPLVRSNQEVGSSRY